VVVVTFDPEQYNFIAAEKNSYFLLLLEDGSRLIVNNRCQHRGGPLHLGHWDDARKCLVCPWHQTRYSEKALRMQAEPSVMSGGKLTVVLNEADAAQVVLSPKAVLVRPGCDLEVAVPSET
jgi:nitrite reductase/ring-hydroxylating ferredoxin subunit